MTSEELKARIFEDLDNARENGYDQLNDPDEMIAQEILDFTDIYNVQASLEPADLIPHIQAWKESRKHATH